MYSELKRRLFLHPLRSLAQSIINDNIALPLLLTQCALKKHLCSDFTVKKDLKAFQLRATDINVIGRQTIAKLNPLKELINHLPTFSATLPTYIPFGEHFAIVSLLSATLR